MRKITTRTSVQADMREAEDAARTAAGAFGGEPMLVAWYDTMSRTGGPLEVCADEPAWCVESYAASHGADYRVKVSGSGYEFYYIRLPVDVMQLEREAVLANHLGLVQDQFENFQGG